MFNPKTDIEKPIDRNQYFIINLWSGGPPSSFSLEPSLLTKKEDLIAGYNISDLSIVIESLKTYYFFFRLCI